MITDELKQLWKTVFGDPDSFIDTFFAVAFSSDRCLFIEDSGKIVSALYWFDCEYEGGKLAYIYAVATHPDHRGKGLASHLMENAHILLKAQGLFPFYERLGYVTSGCISRFSASASSTPVPLKPLSAETYGLMRAAYLPDNAVTQDGLTLEFLSTFAALYATEDALICTAKAEPFIFEYLGNPNSAPDILAALGIKTAEIQTVGEDIPFTMFYPLNCTKIPGYLGITLE